MCDEHEKCCLQGPQGVPGIQGQQGIQGVPGPQGIQGIPGKDCESKECKCALAYMNVYSLASQVKGPYTSGTDVVLFDSQGAVSSEFDISAKNTTGAIKFLTHGIYSLSWVAQANMTPPIPAPVPSYSFALFLDGTLLPGSVNSSFTQSPNDDNSHTTGQTIVEVMAGQILTLKNASTVSVSINPLPSGSIFPIANASIVAVLLKKLP